jgi:hypothetical protein
MMTTTDIKYLAVDLAIAYGEHIGNIYKHREDCSVSCVQDLPEYKELIRELEELDNASS